MKKYKLNGIEVYVIECRNLFQALVTCQYNQIGVTEHDLTEYHGEIPENAILVMEGV